MPIWSSRHWRRQPVEQFSSWDIDQVLALLGIIQLVVVAPAVYAIRQIIHLNKLLDSKASESSVEALHDELRLRVTKEDMREYVSLTQEPIKQMCQSIQHDVEWIRNVLEERSNKG